MLKSYKNKQYFMKDHFDFLEKDEVMNNLMIGLLQKDYVVPDLLVAVTNKQERVLGMIAGKHMILAANTINPTLYNELVIYMDTVDYPGIIGPTQYSEVYKKMYSIHCNNTMNKLMSQRIYACDRINHVSHETGDFRLATIQDINTLIPWAYDFEVMIEGHANIENITEMLKKRILANILYVLVVNHEIVSMAQRTRPLAKTETVSLVYTPKDKRKKGYASRVVELLTQEILNDGKIATLYTDLSNPTSNKIYINIGYKPHCDSVVYKIDKSQT
ncbi:GNAT family N-acetyltransferase [Candidatus Izimaplasma bacterium]|nr:GNAT family N-acetyltransferase [Candidatus Izimaplasma bacterium]